MFHLIHLEPLMMKKILFHIKEFWKTNLIVFLALLSTSLLYLYCQNQEFSIQWFITTIFIPYIISCLANFSTANKQSEKIKLFKKRDMDMNSTCSEIVGFLKGSVNKKINEEDLKHLLSQTKKLQSSIIRKE